jgi:hypothetical protein
MRWWATTGVGSSQIVFIQQSPGSYNGYIQCYIDGECVIEMCDRPYESTATFKPPGPGHYMFRLGPGYLGQSPIEIRVDVP